MISLILGSRIFRLATCGVAVLTICFSHTSFANSQVSPIAQDGTLMMICQSTTQPSEKTVKFDLNITAIQVDNEKSTSADVVRFTIKIDDRISTSTRILSSAPSGGGVNFVELFGEEFLFRLTPIDLRVQPISLTFQSGPLAQYAQFPIFAGNCSEANTSADTPK